MSKSEDLPKRYHWQDSRFGAFAEKNPAITIMMGLGSAAVGGAMLDKSLLAAVPLILFSGYSTSIGVNSAELHAEARAIQQQNDDTTPRQ